MRKVSDDVEYKNVLLKSYENGCVTVNVYGIIKQYKVRKVYGFVENSLAFFAVPCYIMFTIKEG